MLFLTRIMRRWQSLAKFAGVYPRSIVLEPTNRCNVSCVVCQRRELTRPVGDLSFERFRYVVESIPTLKRISLYFMGEPFLNSAIFDMIRYASNRGIRTGVSTNSSLIGSYVPEILGSGLDTLACSLDGMSQETLAKYRRGSDFQKTIAGIIDLLTEQQRQGLTKPQVHIRFLVFRHNEHEINAIRKFANSYRIRLDLVKPILDWGLPRLPKVRRKYLSTITRYQRYLEDGLLKEPSGHCGYEYSPVITWDGLVVPCCFDVNGEYALGNVFDTPFHGIFWNQSYRKLRKHMMQQSLPLCAVCKHVVKPFETLKPSAP